MRCTYQIKGVELTMNDMRVISEFYEAQCTAEYILYNYDVDEDTALELGHAVRQEMADYGCSEDDAIYEVLKREGII